MSQIVEPKSYEGKELENNFFRPILSGGGAESLGIRVLYNMPMPTTINVWKGARNALSKFSAGWTGAADPTSEQRTIDMRKVKSEMGYSAANYYAMVYERLSGLEPNMDDLSGTSLEQAETQMFRDVLAESLRATMWLGSTKRTNGKFDTFDGFLPLIVRAIAQDPDSIPNFDIEDAQYMSADAGDSILKGVWDQSSTDLKELKGEGNLAFFVTSEIYSLYEDSLNAASFDGAYTARQQGRPQLMWRGIPVIDIQSSSYLRQANDIPFIWAVLTDKRNLALAVNTSDIPGSEVRMWYNPDEMENRQRAVFGAGCAFMLPELISVAYKNS